MTEFSTVRNVIFDFGGVLFDIDYHAPLRAFEALGFRDFGSIYSQAAQQEVFDQLETGKISNEAFWRYLHDFVPQASQSELEHAWNCILLQLWPERVDFVKKVKSAGYRTFLLSNTNAIHVAAFETMIEQAYGLDSFYAAFEKVHYSNVIGIKKPYPSTYLTLCDWHGLQPKETIFIDDSIQHVKGAAEAGLVAVHLQPGTSVEQRLAELLP
jgi:glucose-1-phosphatase